MILDFFLLVVGFVILIKGADFFVDGASSIADNLGANGSVEVKSNSLMRIIDAVDYDVKCEEAKSLGADAIVGVRFGSSAIMQGAAEMLAYGTAVKTK